MRKGSSYLWSVYNGPFSTSNSLHEVSSMRGGTDSMDHELHNL